MQPWHIPIYRKRAFEAGMEFMDQDAKEVFKISLLKLLGANPGRVLTDNR
jgi:hypothetical protein